jgi:hypothetical protein
MEVGNHSQFGRNQTYPKAWGEGATMAWAAGVTSAFLC